jgi:hypothetical protein
MTIVLPIYWTKTFKTKPDKTILCGMNWYRNAHHFDQNKWKKEFAEIVHQQLPQEFIPLTTYKLFTKLYYKNPNCDGENITSLIHKVVLDALQEYNLAPQDSVKYHLGSAWVVEGQDKENPRAEITLIPIEEL